MAWYSSRSSERAKVTRAGEIMADGGSVDLPPAPKAALLIAHISSCGISREGFSGQVPLTAQELSAWAKGTSTTLGPIDFQDMLDTSRAYVTALMEFDTVMINAPWAPEMTAEENDQRIAAEERAFDIMMGVTNGS